MTPDHQHWWARPDPAALPGTTVPSQISAFHRSMPDYDVTPLVEMPAVARSARVGKVLVKDESQRLGLPAFKMLGASWAIARLVARQAGVPAPSTFAELKELAAGSPLQLLAATAGNHGRAVARVAGLLGVEAKVWIPAASPAELADAVAGEGAEVTVIDDDYDEALRLAAKAVELHPSAALLQDTAWDGYEDVPGWVVEGYSTLFAELSELTEPADVLVVPAGVGSLLQAAVAYRAPSTTALAVESASAACLLASLRAGQPRRISTGTTVMAGLNAGTVSTIAWPVLRDGVTAAVAVDDAAALAAARVLDGGGVPAGPCGGGSMAGFLAAAELPELRAALRLDESSTVVVLSTDGRT
ncbi:pyridoxal-phosphate dependent enzyme [Pseudonocardia sp. TRM90224]|uniref:pyridoxal-phosphate dependent enzyme n=1 Tax=Pseudonocardia sp. TRM90224 TaxID=2812678 RepID=UPI001E564543|nr:pyridoxal-phosphate dependent enzyme [Pseudonocardia sp. TRM90224]